MPANEPSLRTLLVGIDGASLPVLESFDDGVAPTLESLVAEGTSGPLESSIPPWTPSAWPSLYTGTNPGKHGVFGFLAFEGYDWSVVDATHVRERPVWQVLDRHGISSVVVNVPVTHPPEPFDGALIPGYTAPEDPTCHPEGLLGQVREAVGDYRVYPRREGGRSPVEAYREAVAARGGAFRHLVDRFDPEFGFLQFQATDTVCHEHPGDEAALQATYAAVDDQIARTMEACAPETVVVASDHGIGPLSGREFRANEFLRERGHLQTTRGGGMPTWSGVRDRKLRAGEDPGGGETGASVTARLGAALASVGITSQRVGRALSVVGLAEPLARALPSGLVRGGSERVDFENSRAYVRSRIECGVRINLESREPEGVVPRAEYERLRERLIEELSGVETPDGDPVFEAVDRRERFFEGPELDRAPDVVTVPAGFEQFLSASLAGGQFGDPSEPWNHKRHGLIALEGRAVGSGDLEDPQIYDVAPTVLATLGVPHDERADGRVLEVVDAAGSRAYPRPDPPDRDGTDDRTVTDRLEAMGYIQ